MSTGKARLCVAVAVLGLGTLTLAPVLSGHAADGGTGVRGRPPFVAPSLAPTVGGRPAVAPAMNTLAPSAPALTTPASDSGPSPAVYPPPSFPLTFDHARHARLGIGCERCHGAALTSVNAKDNLLPAEQACRACHAIDRTQPRKSVPPGQPAARCDACHPGFSPPPAPAPAAAPGPGKAQADRTAATGEQGQSRQSHQSHESYQGWSEPARVVLPAPALKFNHKLHVGRGIACGLCHAGVENVALATTAQLPKMSLCLGCHDGKQATARCGACHPTLPDGRLRTAFPSGRLIPSGSLKGVDAHTSSFRTQHKAAGREERYCATCHKQSECTECHGAGVIRPVDFHPADYATLHAVDARRNSPNCSSCHRNQTFCLGCHQRLGVAPDPEGGQAGRQPNNPFGTGTGVKRFHPPGWVRDEAGVVLTTPTPASHSMQARRNLRTCVSCHREESCMSCHSADPTRSMGISPHPPGFAQSPTCRALSERNARACLKCHTPGEAALTCQ